MPFEYEPFVTYTTEMKEKGLLLYARCYDEKMAQNYISLIKPYVSKILIEFEAPNVYSCVPVYKIYVLDKEADNIIGLFENGKRVGA